MSTLYSIGQMNQLGDALESAGFTPDDVTKLRSSDLSKIRRLVQGLMMVVEVCLKIVLSKLFNPAEFIGQGWTVWKGPVDGDGLSGDEDRDVREDALTEIDWSKVEFETHLKDEDGENSIAGEEKLRRSKTGGKIQLGGRAFLSVWEDYKAKGADSILEKLRLTRGVKRIYFFGLVLRNPCGGRYVLYLCFYGGGWDWRYDWLGDDWRASAPSAALASI